MAFEGHTPAIVTPPDHNGRVVLTYAGYSHEIRFTWKALAGLQAAWGDDFLAKAAKAMDEKDIHHLAELLSFGSDLELEEVLELAIPIISTAQALALAWQVAWTGQYFEDWDKAAKPVEDEDAKPEKTKAPATLWGQFVSKLSSWGLLG